jgi:carotenoid 1,2-hydratase
VRWRGDGYLDTNAGDEPIDRGFRGWHWSRAHRRHETAIFYDAERRDGTCAGLALAIDRDGAIREDVAAPPMLALRPTGWRVDRRLRVDAGAKLGDHRLLEDAPFYARTQASGMVGGEPAQIVHESLAADRLRSPIVRAMLPFRMPRLAG